VSLKPVSGAVGKITGTAPAYSTTLGKWNQNGAGRRTSAPGSASATKRAAR
jgi:hypothetical protein